MSGECGNKLRNSVLFSLPSVKILLCEILPGAKLFGIVVFPYAMAAILSAFISDVVGGAKLIGFICCGLILLEFYNDHISSRRDRSRQEDVFVFFYAMTLILFALSNAVVLGGVLFGAIILPPELYKDHTSPRRSRTFLEATVFGIVALTAILFALSIGGGILFGTTVLLWKFYDSNCFLIEFILKIQCKKKCSFNAAEDVSAVICGTTSSDVNCSAVTDFNNYEKTIHLANKTEPKGEIHTLLIKQLEEQLLKQHLSQSQVTAEVEEKLLETRCKMVLSESEVEDQNIYKVENQQNNLLDKREVENQIINDLANQQLELLKLKKHGKIHSEKLSKKLLEMGKVENGHRFVIAEQDAKLSEERKAEDQNINELQYIQKQPMGQSKLEDQILNDLANRQLELFVLEQRGKIHLEKLSKKLLEMGKVGKGHRFVIAKQDAKLSEERKAEDQNINKLKYRQKQPMGQSKLEDQILNDLANRQLELFVLEQRGKIHLEKLSKKLLEMGKVEKGHRFEIVEKDTKLLEENKLEDQNGTAGNLLPHPTEVEQLFREGEAEEQKIIELEERLKNLLDEGEMEDPQTIALENRFKRLFGKTVLLKQDSITKVHQVRKYSVLRCQRCQRFGHSTCFKNIICGYCAKNHYMFNCHRTEIRCANCQRWNELENTFHDIRHTALAANCPTYGNLKRHLRKGRSFQSWLGHKN